MTRARRFIHALIKSKPALLSVLGVVKKEDLNWVGAVKSAIKVLIIDVSTIEGVVWEVI